MIALGCAVTGAVFSTVNGWLSARTAIPNAEHLVVVSRLDNRAVNPTGYSLKAPTSASSQLGDYTVVV